MKLIVALMMVALSGVALAEDTAGAVAKPIVYTGKLGMAPVQVAYDYLKERVADEYGIGEYRELLLTQKTTSKAAFNQVELELQLQGIVDDAVKTQRYQMSLSFVEATSQWQIDSVKQDWQCRSGKKSSRTSKAWTQRPCSVSSKPAE